MHELQLANSILRIVSEQEAIKQGKTIIAVNVIIGEFAGVMIEALKSAFQSLIVDTKYRNAQLNTTVVKGKAKCTQCATVFEIDQAYANCPQCQNPQIDIIQGRELYVKSIEVE